ncbi:uncharacterized protein LOC144674746 [Cetorhinus maximus]
MAPFLQIDPLSPYGKNKTLRKLPPISPGAQDAEFPAPQTKLDLLKCQFQQKLEREKQVKLMAIYKQQYQEALYRLRSTYLLEAHLGPYKKPANYEHPSAEVTFIQSPPPEDQNSTWTQIAHSPQGKRSAGIDRSHPLRPIDRRSSGLSNILNLEEQSSDWRSFIPLDAPMWPAVTFRPSPPKESRGKCQSSRPHLRSRERFVELRPVEDSTCSVQLRQRSNQYNISACAKEQEPREVQNNHQNGRLDIEVEICKKESLIQGRLRKIEEELRQIQMQRDQAEEEEMQVKNMVELARVERGAVERERSERERPGREKSEKERDRSGREGSERERPERERDRSGRERSEREREREKLERERAKRDRAERERAERERAERERAEREREEKERLLEVEREAKQRQREKLNRENVRDVDDHRAAKNSSDKSYKMKTSSHYKREEVNEESSFDGCSSEEYTDHSNPFADYKENTCESKNDTDDDTEDRAHYADSSQNERTEWNGHYSPEEKAHCSFCGRRFVLDRLNTHTEICKKVYKRKRKVYDSAQKRAKGTDLENYQCCHKITPAPGVILVHLHNAPDRGRWGHSSSNCCVVLGDGFACEMLIFTLNLLSLQIALIPISKKVNWKLKHDAFIRMLHAAQQIELEIYRGKKKSDTAAPSPSLNSDYIQCPHCSRRFEPNVAQSHIPKCKTLRSRPAPPKR